MDFRSELIWCELKVDHSFRIPFCSGVKRPTSGDEIFGFDFKRPWAHIEFKAATVCLFYTSHGNDKVI